MGMIFVFFVFLHGSCNIHTNSINSCRNRYSPVKRALYGLNIQKLRRHASKSAVSEKPRRYLPSPPSRLSAVTMAYRPSSMRYTRSPSKESEPSKLAPSRTLAYRSLTTASRTALAHQRRLRKSTMFTRKFTKPIEKRVGV